MRCFLLSVLLTLPTLAPLAQASPEAVKKSLVVLSASEIAPDTGVFLPPVADPDLYASSGNVALTALAATGAYVIGGAVGYMIVDAIDPTDEAFWDEPSYSSEGVLYGIPIEGTLASGLAAHLVSSPDDPLWRTVLVPLAVQGAFIAGSHLFLST